MSAMLEIRHLRLVRAVAEEGGPTRAAARLHLTQSAVSHQLAELEGRLGVVLFTRVRRRLALTAAGARLLDTARTMLGELARVERELHHVGARKREVLRLATECFTAYHWLPAIVAALGREQPHVEVRIELAATREPVTALLRGELELALVSSPVRDRQLVATALFDDEWTVICAPGHPLAQRPYVTAVELGTTRLFAHDAPRSDVERLRELIASERAAMPDVQRVPLTDALVELVKAGLGVGLVSRWAVAPYTARGEIVTRRFTRGGLPERWVAAYRSDAATRLPLTRFVERLRELIASERAAMPDVQRVPLTDALVELVKAGLGVGLVSRWAVAPYTARGEIVTRRFTRGGLPERWVAAYRSDAATRLPLARFVELLRAHPPAAPPGPRRRRR